MEHPARAAAHDPYSNVELESHVRYVDLPPLYRESDIISLHCPLVPETHHLIDENALAKIKDGVC